MTETVFYAIGDIHGQAENLKSLHQRIICRHQRDFPQLGGTIIHLGDYVDRGPDSFDVIELIMRLEKNSKFTVVNLKGNHEQLMLDACNANHITARTEWLNNGGEATLRSYAANGLAEPCQHHLDWMAALPILYWEREAGYIFVHAGVDPKIFPNENDNIRLWTRSRAFFEPSLWQSPDLKDMIVVHGHTPTATDQPEIAKECRINIDTGACYGGPLTAAVLAPGCDVEFLQVYAQDSYMC